jgi:hypothetical protein
VLLAPEKVAPEIARELGRCRWSGAGLWLNDTVVTSRVLGVDRPVPHPTTLVKLVRGAGPEVVDQLIAALLGKLAGDKLLRGRKLRVDTTVVEADVDDPTDADLLEQAVRKVGGLVRRIKGRGAASRTRFRDRGRAAGRRMQAAGADAAAADRGGDGPEQGHESPTVRCRTWTRQPVPPTAYTFVNYSFRRAHETNAFHQFPLITPSKLPSEARDRGIRPPFASKFVEELERLDREGAFSPMLFEMVDADGADTIVFRDEGDYVPWSEYAIDDGFAVAPRPYYSPWQLLYFNDAVELQHHSVPIEWLLDDDRRATLGSGHRDFLSWQLERWRQLDWEWRGILLVLLRLQNRYGPAVKGTLIKSTVNLVRHPQTGEYVDPSELTPPFDARKALDDLGLTHEALEDMHRRLAIQGMMGGDDDPLRDWHMLVRMAPAKQRARLRGIARRAQDAYDAAEMLRRFYFDLTGELLPNPDEIFDLSDKSWKRQFFGKWPTFSYTRADLAVELRLRDLHPHQVHIVVEGDTEEIVCRRVLETVAGMPLNDMGVSIQRLLGVGNMRGEMLRALKTFPRFLVFVADREGDMAREVEGLKQEGVLTDEATYLWETSFEEANVSDEELVTMIAVIGADRGATLTLNAQEMRALYDAHRSKAGGDAKGLATFALGLARREEYGSVAAAKTELAERMADLILNELRERDGEAVSEERPIASMLVSVFRVT